MEKVIRISTEARNNLEETFAEAAKYADQLIRSFYGKLEEIFYSGEKADYDELNDEAQSIFEDGDVCLTETLTGDAFNALYDNEDVAMEFASGAEVIEIDDDSDEELKYIAGQVEERSKMSTWDRGYNNDDGYLYYENVMDLLEEVQPQATEFNYGHVFSMFSKVCGEAPCF